MVKKFTEWKMLPFATRGDERRTYMHLVKELNEFYDYVNSYINLGSEVQFLDLPKLSDDIKDLKEQFEELKKKPSSSGNVDLTEVDEKITKLTHQLDVNKKTLEAYREQIEALKKKSSSGNVDLTEVNNKIKSLEEGIKNIKPTSSGTISDNQLKDIKSHVLDEITKSLPITEIMNKLNTQMEKNISSITKEEIEKLKVELEKDDEKY